MIRQTAGVGIELACDKLEGAGSHDFPQLVDARDLNDAIQIAAKIPPAREGSIEVRPVRELVV